MRMDNFQKIMRGVPEWIVLCNGSVEMECTPVLQLLIVDAIGSLYLCRNECK